MYFEDTDAAGIMYYANYLKFFERARTEWLRSLDVQLSQIARDCGATLVVSEAHIAYQKPAQLDDLLEISTVLDKLGRASLSVTQICRRAGLQLAVCTLRIGCIDLQTKRPAVLPVPLQQALASQLPPSE